MASKINYETEIANAERLVNALKNDIATDATGKRIQAAHQAIDKLKADIALFELQQARLPAELARAESKLNQLRREAQLVNNKQLQELLKLRAQLEAKIAKVTTKHKA